MFYSEVVGGAVSWKLMQLDATNWLKKSWQEMLIKGCWSRNVSHFKEIKFKEIMFSSQEGKITSLLISMIFPHLCVSGGEYDKKGLIHTMCIKSCFAITMKSNQSMLSNIIAGIPKNHLA